MPLLSGYKKFFKKYFQDQPELYQQLVHGQAPETLFLACCDSRIDPAILTSAQPGELFVIRNIANYVPSYVSRALESEAMTAIEFAVCNLAVKQIIVLGHQHCAGVKAIAAEGKGETISTFPVVWHEQRARLQDAIKEPYSSKNSQKFEKENIILACHDLLTYPFIQAHGVRVTGWYFSLETGSIDVYNPDDKAFVSLKIT